MPHETTGSGQPSKGRKFVKAQRCRATSKTTGRRCGYPAVRGKDVCRFHGGLTPVKHGLFSKYAKESLAQHIEENLRSPRLVDIRERVALVDALTQDLLQRNSKNGKQEISADEREALLKLTEASARMIRMWKEVEEGLKMRVEITVLQAFVAQVTEVIRIELADDPTRLERLAARLAALGLGPAGSRAAATA